MAVVTAERFIELVKKSKLASPEQLEAALERIRKAGAGELPSDPVRLSEALQQEKVITRWQTEKLLQGKYKGFFLGKYKLLGHIGSGGMSSVYLAEHTMMHDHRAIKVLPPSKMSKSSYLARFQQEAKAIAALNHPNIVRAYDIDNQGDTHYIVMEYVNGDDLQTLVKKKGPLPYEMVANYISQAARGLQHAHESGLIHRDVKPANLLVGKDGVIKLLDLGLALFTDEGMASLTIDHNDKVLGTADYLAPEQALNSHGVDHRADLYGLGCTMYYLLTGQPPFPDGSIAQRIAKHQKMMPEEIRKFRSNCPGELEGICWKLMQKDPKYRYANARQTAEVLESWLAKSRVAVGAGSGSSVRLGEESDQRTGGPRSSGAGSALGDTVSNRGGDTLGDRSSTSEIQRLSASDSGTLIRLANSSSSGSQIDLQADILRTRRRAALSGGPGAGGAGAAVTGTAGGGPRAAGESALLSKKAKKAGLPTTGQPQETSLPGQWSISGSNKIYWIVGAIAMFLLAVLLGMVIARLTDSWSAPTVDPSSVIQSDPQ
jgi:eukaryotic-like serine/threonine-protein kinase